MPLLIANGISKRFPGVQALKEVSVEFEPGSCHALMGENGAGKSTLGKILAGLYSPDSGVIVLDGKEVQFHGPLDAVRAGIGMVHQELLFAENMSVAENLCLGDLPRNGLWLDNKEMVRRSREWLTAIGAEIDESRTLGDLPISKQQLVQIAGAIGKGARVLIFDEPTSALSQAEARRLLGLIAELKSAGVTCIYISHRLEEIFAVCDKVTVLRDGEVVGSADVHSLTRDDLVRMMIGRDLAASLAHSSDVHAGSEVLRVENLSSPGKFGGVSFAVRAGEVLGVAGLVGAGRTEITEAIFGLDPRASGNVYVHGEPMPLSGPSDAMKRGIGLVPEDRKRHGLVLSLTAKSNISLPTLPRVSALGWVRDAAETALAQRFFDRMRVKAPTLDAATAGLSGGNQQKLVIAKWLAARSDVLIVDEPTRGVDVGAKAEIHNLLRDLAKEGKAVFLVSSDLPELLALSNRILVMREGRLVGELPGGATEEQVMRLMAGVLVPS